MILHDHIVDVSRKPFSPVFKFARRADYVMHNLHYTSESCYLTCAVLCWGGARCHPQYLYKLCGIRRLDLNYYKISFTCYPNH